ncbi:hypothetical protein Glove_271g119 [Diversispora epigaea]|uniref:Uncharacterized protein n=1 Tax=Diversispora epigaea TaxID=1348612 RepID=A0A397I890_9GLOM|nr:hypothetical protein Glove_271g119 [Diversispora epigaea]
MVFVSDDFKSKRKRQKAIRRADVNYRQCEREQQRKRREIQPIEAQIPLRVLELNNEFDLLKERYANWPQLVNKIVANNALAEFRDNTSCDSLRELTCAVCSGLFSFKYLNTVSVQEICLPLLEVNKYLEKSFFEIDFVYGHPYIDRSGYKILFDRNRFVKNDDNENPFDLRLCNNCKQSLKAGNTPIFSLANMWIGTTPQCLQGLTIPEQLLISTGYICINLIQLNNRGHTHHKLKSHVITFTQELTSLSKILSLPVYRLCDHLKVVFVGDGQPSDEQLKKILCVRKNKVAVALEWLINHNVLYKNVKLDETALESLLENGVPTALLATTVVVNIDSEKIEHYTGYTMDPIDEYDMNNDLDDISDKEISSEKNISRLYDPITELRNSGVTYTDNIPISEQERTLRVLEKIIQELTDDKQICSRTILMPHSNVPRNEYTDLSLLPAAFPTLFPYGVGGHEDNFRKHHVPFKQYVKHLLRVHDSKFRHHRSFIFATFDMLRRREIALGTYLITKQSKFKQSAELISKLTPNDIKIAIEQIHNNQPIVNRAVLELTRNVNVVGGKIMGSHQSRILLRNEIHAVIIRDGSPSLFITINPADLHSSIVMMYAGKEIDINTLLPEDFPTATERAKLAHIDPTAVAKYFNVVIEKTIKFIIGYKKPEGGVFGEIKNYYAITEYQDCGTPHCHMLIWLHGAPNSIELRDHLKSEDFGKRLIIYLSEIIKEDISYLFPNNKDFLTDEMLNVEYKTPKTSLEKKIHLSILPIPDPRSPNFDENFRLDVLRIAKRTLFHRCTKSCKKYYRGRTSNCHFDFPRELVKVPGKIYPELGIITLQRFNAYINNHNPYITASCRGNNDIRFIATVKLALAYIYYITNYITKTDASTHNSFLLCAMTLNKFVTKISNPIELSKEFVPRSRKLVTMCLNKIVEQTEMTGPQVSAYLLNIKDHYTPNKFVSIYLNSFETYLTSRYPIENLPESYLFPNNKDFLTDEMLNVEYKTPKTSLEKKIHLSILPIPDPRSPNFDENFRLDVLRIAKRTLFHRCTKSCKKYYRGRTSNCHFDFPRELVKVPGKIYPELGIITLQRFNAYINNHNPYITASCRGNNDIRFIATVKLALAYIYYITNYITKTDASTHNSFLLCAMTLNKFVTKISNPIELSKEFVPRSRKLVTMCLNKIVEQTEMTGPQVSAYLLNIKDHYTPNKFVSIYLNSFETYLTSRYPIENLPESLLSEDSGTDGNEDELDQENNNNYDSIDNEIFTIINSDYMYHGKQLENMCLYDYVSMIHKIKINEKELNKLSRQKNREGYATRVDRFLFLGGEKKCDENCDHNTIYPQHSTHIQIHWYRENERIPILHGKNILSKEDLKSKEHYGLYILLLFKPWTTADDLITKYSSWYEACNAFLQNSNLSTRLQFIIKNIELLHRCSEETMLDRRLRQLAYKDPEIAKIQ